MVGVSEPAEAFLDQLVTWRELGFNMAWQRSDYDQYDALPDWARHTLAEHAEDVRPHVYSLEELEAGKTHDPLVERRADAACSGRPAPQLPPHALGEEDTRVDPGSHDVPAQKL